MMVMSFLNELEGGKKISGEGGGGGGGGILSVPPPNPLSIQKILPNTTFTHDQRGHSGLSVQTPPQHIPPHPPHTPHITMAGDVNNSMRVNHNGDTTPLSIRPPATTMAEAPPQDTMHLTPLYPGACDSSGTPIGRLERGDSASSMSQLDLGLSDDSNPLIDQLESALESDSSLQAKTSPEDHVPGDMSSCSEGARDECQGEEVPQQQQQQEQPTEMFMSLLGNPQTDGGKVAPENECPPRSKSPPSPVHEEKDTPASPTETAPTEITEKGQKEPEKETASDNPENMCMEEEEEEEEEGEKEDATATHRSPRTSESLTTSQDTPKEVAPPSKDTGSTPQEPEPMETGDDKKEEEGGDTDQQDQTTSDPTDNRPPSRNSPEGDKGKTDDVNNKPSDPIGRPSPPKSSSGSPAVEEPEVLSFTEEEQTSALEKVVEIPTVYIVEPKVETPPPASPELNPEILFVTSRVSHEDDEAEQTKKPPQKPPQQKEAPKERPKERLIYPKTQTPPVPDNEVRVKRIVMPKKTSFFESTRMPAGKEKVTVMCYVCDTNVKGPQFKNHLFFGFVRCHYCNRRLMGCRLLKEDLTNPDKSTCFSSPNKKHNFSKWASDPIEHLSYYIRKELVIKRFCAGKTKPPPVSEIVEEIYTYINKLAALESVSPWCYAYERCQKYIQERVAAEPKAFSEELTKGVAAFPPHIAELSSRSNSPVVNDSSSTPPPPGRPSTTTSTTFSPAIRVNTQPVLIVQDGIVTKPGMLIKPTPPQPPSKPPHIEPVCVIESPPVTQSDESVDDPMEVMDDAGMDSDAEEVTSTTPTPTTNTATTTVTTTEQGNTTTLSRKSLTPSASPSLENTQQIVKVRNFSSLSQPPTPNSNTKEQLDAAANTRSKATPPPTIPIISQAATQLHSLLAANSTNAASFTPSPSTTQRSTPTLSKTTTPEATPVAPSDVVILDEPTPTPPTPPPTILRQNVAGTTLIRQWETKAKSHTVTHTATHAPSSRKLPKGVQADSWQVKNENYLIVKYPSEPCPDVCPSCYTAFNPLQATVQCSSYLMTVKCNSCKLTLFVSQDPPPPRPKKKRRV